MTVNGDEMETRRAELGEAEALLEGLAFAIMSEEPGDSPAPEDLAEVCMKLAVWLLAEQRHSAALLEANKRLTQ